MDTTAQHQRADTAIVAYPDLEANLARPEQEQDTDRNRHEATDVMQPTTPSSSSSRLAFYVPPHWREQAIRQWYSDQAGRWWYYYYDPTRPSHPPSTAIPGPPHPPNSTPSGTAPPAVTDTMPEPILTSLKALQSQFTAFQVDLCGVKSDLKNALSQLHTLRTTQTKTEKSIAELESVIGASPTGARTRGRGKRAGAGGRGKGSKTGTTTEIPLVAEGADAGTPPEKTLVQSIASIQSAIEALLVHDSRVSYPPVPRQGSFIPSTNHLAGQAHFPTPQSSLLPSIVVPTMQSMQFTFRATPTSPSRPSSPLSSIAIHTPESGISLPPAALEKEYADASIQAHPPTPSSEPSSALSNSHEYTPGFVPVDWNVNPVRSTAFTPEYLVRFLHDAHRPSMSNTIMETQISGGGSDHSHRGLTTLDTKMPTHAAEGLASSSYPDKPNSGAQRAESTTLPLDPSSPVQREPSVEAITPSTEIPSISTKVPIQIPHLRTHSLYTKDRAGSLMTLPEISPSNDSQLESLNSLSDSRDIHTPPSQANILVQNSQWFETPSPTAEAERKTPQVTSAGDPQMSFASSPSGIHSEPTSVLDAPGSKRHENHPGKQSTELPSEDTRMACNTQGDMPSVINRAPGSMPTISGHDRRPLPIETDDQGLPSCLPTPQSDVESEPHLVSRSTREHSVDRDPKLMLHTQFPRTFPVIPTPPPWTPDPLLGEDRGLAIIGEGAAGQGSFEVVPGPPLPLMPPSFSPSSAVENLSAREDVDAVNACIGAHKVMEVHTNSLGDAEATVVDGADAAGGGGRTPGFPVSPSNTDPPVRDPGADDVDPVYSPPHAYGEDYDFHFSSPWHGSSPLTSSMPSRYATPSESSEVYPMQDEDEVWHALMLDVSGVTTPTSLPMMFSHEPSRASSVQPHSHSLNSVTIAVDPSVLQLRNSQPSVYEPGPGPNSPQPSDRSLSPLTSLEDADNDRDGNHNSKVDPVSDNAARATSKAPSIHTAESGETSQSNSRGATLRSGRRSEPLPPVASRSSCALGQPLLVERAGSETTMVSLIDESSRPAGGPNASLDELTVLARREPLKICLKVPREMRGVKRKRDGNGDDNLGVDYDNEGSEAEGREDGAMGDAAQNGDLSAAQIEADTRILTLAVSLLAPEKPANSGLIDRTREQPYITSDLPDSRKIEGEHRHKKLKRVPKDSKSFATYRFEDSQIVRVTPEPEPDSSAPIPSASRGEQDAQRHPKGRENHAMKKSLSSPAKSTHTSSRGTHPVKSSPPKADIQNMLSGSAGIWPELPSMFSQWDVQFIQCDNCDKWYHYGCVAIESGDPRLELSALFICPTCHIHNPKRQTSRNSGDTCARLDCPEPQVTADSETYFVEKLVGRKKVEGYIYMWLAKWEGYPMSQATWIPKENVVGSSAKLINTFLEDAVEEGADLSSDVILLQGAVDAGWDSEMC